MQGECGLAARRGRPRCSVYPCVQVGPKPLHDVRQGLADPLQHAERESPAARARLVGTPAHRGAMTIAGSMGAAAAPRPASRGPMM